MKRILVLGAGGQIGSELVPYLRSIYGASNVVATDVKHNAVLAEAGPFESLDALDAKQYAELVDKYKIDSIFNLVALLSATARYAHQHGRIGELVGDCTREELRGIYSKFYRCFRW